jgi:hypothetical protein
MYIELPELAEKGYVLLDRCDLAIPPAEYEGLEYRDWKSGGDTNFAPIASAYGAVECAGFWDHGKPDKGGVWTSNAERCPTLVEWASRVGADFGRVRTIKLEPNVLTDVERWLRRQESGPGLGASRSCCLRTQCRTPGTSGAASRGRVKLKIAPPPGATLVVWTPEIEVVTSPST